MTPNPHNPPLSRRLALTLPRRQALSPDELARRQVRRRLLRYILANHRRRVSHGGRGLASAEA